MTNSEQAIREFAVNNGHREYFIDGDMDGFNADPRFLSDLTALISEHYVSREEYDEEKKSNSLLHKAMVTAEKGGHDKAMEEISEHYYPKEFVEWAIRYARLWDIGNQMEYTFVTKDGNIDSLPFDELFNYWVNNKK